MLLTLGVVALAAVIVGGLVIWLDYRAWKREERMAEIRREMEQA